MGSSGDSEDSTDLEDCDLQGAGSNSLKYLEKCKTIRIIFQQYHPAESINLLKIANFLQKDQNELPREEILIFAYTAGHGCATHE